MREDDKGTCFFDTSALVKRYHSEVGTDLVDAAFGDKEAVRIISDISVVEFYSAFAKKVRTGEITKDDFRETVREMAEDIRTGVIELAFFGDKEKNEAAALIEKYGLLRSLKTMDAMQLAVMKKLSSQGLTHIYCADRSFSTVIGEEGFSVINPEEPPQ